MHVFTAMNLLVVEIIPTHPFNTKQARKEDLILLTKNIKKSYFLLGY